MLRTAGSLQMGQLSTRWLAVWGCLENYVWVSQAHWLLLVVPVGGNAYVTKSFERGWQYSCCLPEDRGNGRTEKRCF